MKKTKKSSKKMLAAGSVVHVHHYEVKSYERSAPYQSERRKSGYQYRTSSKLPLVTAPARRHARTEHVITHPATMTPSEARAIVHHAAKPAKPAKAAKAPRPAKPAKPAKASKPAKAPKPAKASKPAKAAKRRQTRVAW